MISLAIGLMVVLISVFVAETLGRKKILKEESSRKIPHVVSSLAIAGVALFINMRLMEILLAIDTIAVLTIYKFNMLPFARAVNRLSWGELFFPLGLISAALIAPDKWIFVGATLVMGVSDAVAALVGTSIGNHKYRIFGHNKSYEGSGAFLITTILILLLIIFMAPSGLSASWITIVFISFWAMIIEGITPWGLDNLLLPILIATALRML